MATANLGRVGFVNKGTYSGATAYKINDVVVYNSGTYACIQANTGQAPTNTSYWQNWVEDNAVHKTGDETIAGVKTFSSSPISSATQSTEVNALTRKDYVDGLDSANVKLTGDETIEGIKSFSSSPIVPDATTATQAMAYGQGVNLTDAQTIAGVKTLTDGLKLQNQNVSPFSGFKNYIINGNFDVWQYGTSQTSNGYGSDDRWKNSNIGSTKTHLRIECTNTERALFNANYFSRTGVTSVAGATNLTSKSQKIEDVTRLAGKTVTVSFWAKADGNKNIAVEFIQHFGAGGTPSSSVTGIGAQKIALTTTWAKYTVTVQMPSIVGKTLGTDGIHTSYNQFTFWFDAGSDYDLRTNSLGQQSGTFDIAQVQLEEGSVATPFEQRPYGLELSLCQRYYQAQTNLVYFGYMLGMTTLERQWVLKYPTMRTSPTATITLNVGAVTMRNGSPTPSMLCCFYNHSNTTDGIILASYTLSAEL